MHRPILHVISLEIYKVTLETWRRLQNRKYTIIIIPSVEDRFTAIGNVHKNGELWKCDFRIMRVMQDRQTDVAYSSHYFEPRILEASAKVKITIY